MPLNGTQLRQRLTSRTVSPSRTEASAPNYNGGGTFIVTLTFSGGRAALPEDIFDALEVKYGAGKVVTDRDDVTPGQLQLRILP